MSKDITSIKHLIERPRRRPLHTNRGEVKDDNGNGLMRGENRRLIFDEVFKEEEDIQQFKSKNLNFQREQVYDSLKFWDIYGCE